LNAADMRRRPFPIAVAFVIGVLVAAQARINGELSVALSGGLQAAVISFGSGLILLTAMLVFLPRMRRGIPQLAHAVRTRALPRWQILGGLLGGFFVAVQSATVPLLGVAAFTVAVVAGQSANSLLVDRAGLGPAGKQPITRMRVFAAGLALVAVTLAVADRFGDSVNFAPIALGFAVIAGVLIAVQQAMNANVGRAAGSPMTAAWVNFLFGTLGLAAALGIGITLFTGQWTALPGTPWWMYLGGTIGLIFIAAAAWVVPIIGVLIFALASIAGQLFGALALDLILPAPGSVVTWNLIAGVLLALVAVVLSGRRK
jgi:bacterial/archaeal transporter family-2 protein